MDMQDYLLRGVRPEEFRALKRKEKDIFSIVIEGFNDEWKPKVRGITPTIKYNLSRNAIGIYLGDKLIIDDEDLDETERGFVQILYSALEKRLCRLRLPAEEWVDSIPGEESSDSRGVTPASREKSSEDDPVPF